jgi:hypothetical protein
VGRSPFFIHQGELEAEVPPDLEIVASSLSYRPLASVERGAVEESYRRQLYIVAFEPSFYLGVLAVHGPGLRDWDGWYGSEKLPDARLDGAYRRNRRRTLGWVGVGVGLGAAAGGVTLGLLADSSYREYRKATQPAEALRLKQRTQREGLGANILYGVSAVAGLGGAALLLWDWLGAPGSEVPMVETTRGGATLVFHWQW